MKRLFFYIVPALLPLGFFSCDHPAPTTAVTKDSLIKRGAYLVAISGCNDCHSPKRMGPNGPEVDPEKLLSGHPANVPLPPVDTNAAKAWVQFSMDQTVAVGPWGTTFAANLTPDPSGIGEWTPDRFDKAMRQGKFHGIDGTRPILPPMPVAGTRQLTDSDLQAIYTYLQSIRPVRNTVPEWIPPAGAGKK